MFTHLHVHTEYSLLDGLCRIPQLLAKAKELGMTSLAITDHGAMYGAINFYLTALEMGIKPIIGCETYVAVRDHRDRSPTEKSPNHLTLLAKNNTGYRNLVELVTEAHLNGFYYKPRVDKELLSKHREGLVALSGCAHGELARLAAAGQVEQAVEAARWFKRTFEHFYVEIQRYPVPEFERINEALLGIARQAEVPVVATNDVHYVEQRESSIHDLLLCVQTNTTVNDEKRLKMVGDFFYLKSPEEMAGLYSDLPQAIASTEEIAGLCDLKLEFGRLNLPQVELPAGETSDSFLGSLCWQGFDRLLTNPAQEARDRLSYELDVIQKTHFSDYFLVVWDLARFTRQSNILFGVRGSAASSLALYCLGITEINPLEQGLLFERFLNVERLEMPDIDLDFQDNRRDEVIAYVTQKYGADRVAQIITFGTLGARAALRDVGRALGMAYGEVDAIARLVPVGPNVTLDSALASNQELYGVYIRDETVRKLVDTAKMLEGLSRHASTHAAGVVISRETLRGFIPLQRSGRNDEQAGAMAQFSMENIAKLGLLKMDFLGLTNLTLLAKAREVIAAHRGVALDLHRLPLDDAGTYELLSTGETSGVFQLESAGMRRYIKELKPSNFSDIAAMIALYRPGPMENIPTFIKAKYGLVPVQYPHPVLEGILRETYGVIVYQEQVLLIAQALAGYRLGQADVLRKAMGKKIAEVMKKEKKNFLSGAKRLGYPEEVAEQVFALIEPFAGYAFNKAHSVSYALLAYQTAYLKANYPLEYFTAFLNTHIGQQEKVRSGILECRRLGVRVLPPDVNRSQADFVIEPQDGAEGAIRFGLGSIKNVGIQSLGPMLAERERGGPFTSVDDFCRRADLHGMTRKVLESLVEAGVLDSLAPTKSGRGSLLQFDRLMSYSRQEQERRKSGQTSLFDLWGQSVPLSPLDLKSEEVPAGQKLAWEKELLGVYFSEHPFVRSAGASDGVTAVCGDIDADKGGAKVVLAGMITEVRKLYSRKGQPFVAATVEDLTGSVEVVAFNQVYADSQALWQEGKVLLIDGTVRVKDDAASVSCRAVREYRAEKSASNESKNVIIAVRQGGDENGDVGRLNQVMDLLGRYSGQDRVRLVISEPGQVTQLEWTEGVGYCPELGQQLVEILGPGSVDVSPIMQPG